LVEGENDVSDGSKIASAGMRLREKWLSREAMVLSIKVDLDGR